MGTKTEITCLKCAKKNILKRSSLLDLAQCPRCRACDSELLPYYSSPFLRLTPETFVHELDRQMLDALKRIPGIDSVLKFLLRHSFELSMRLHHQGNFLRVSKKQLKGLHSSLENAASILNIDVLPELYVAQDPKAFAYTFGVEKCAIAISTGCLDLLSEDEVLAVLAHELGHVKAKHVLYKTASRVLATVADSIAKRTLGLGGLMLYPIQIALLRWDRASELSSDRASLLVVKNPKTVLTALMKLAGGSKGLSKKLKLEAFIDQADSYEKTKEEGPLGGYISIMNSMFNTHPFPIWRARELIDWVLNGDYLSILQGKVTELPEPEPICQRCGEPLNDELACPTCEEQDHGKGNYQKRVDKAFDSIRSWYEKNFKD